MNQKRIVFIAAQKGGTGKSSLARCLLDYYQRYNLPCAAYDADGSVGQLLQYYGTRDDNGKIVEQQNPRQRVGFFDVRNPDQRDLLLNVVEHGDERIMVDLPAGAIQELDQMLGRHDDGRALIEH